MRTSGLLLGQVTAPGAYPSGACGVARSYKATKHGQKTRSQLVYGRPPLTRVTLSSSRVNDSRMGSPRQCHI